MAGALYLDLQMLPWNYFLKNNAMGEGRGHSKVGISYQDKITLLLSYMFLPKEKIIYIWPEFYKLLWPIRNKKIEHCVSPWKDNDNGDLLL